MFGDDLIFDDFPRCSTNLKQSIEAKKRFEGLPITIGQSHSQNYSWGIREPGEEFFITPFTSPDNGPLAGLVRYINWYQFDKEPLPGTNYEIIPEVLRKRQEWIWLSPSQDKSAGRHVPYLCRGVQEWEGLLPKNRVGFFPVGWGDGNDLCGNGFVLNDELIADDLRLVAIEISSKNGLTNNDVMNLWIALGKPYLEYSKDGYGWTMLGLVNQQLPTINCDGIKIFTGGDFVELSGLGALGCLIDITKEVLSFHAYRFPCIKHKTTTFNPRPNTPREIARLIEMLKFISADCSYDTYMRVVWGILSTGWPEAEQIALDWSLTIKHRFEKKTFNDLVRCYDPDRSGATTMGTIYHLARTGGWRG
jgi:hypothetical protein